MKITKEIQWTINTSANDSLPCEIEHGGNLFTVTLTECLSISDYRLN